MKSQPNRDYKSDDVVMTPRSLAKQIIEHFGPNESVLEPCRGTGNFYRELKNYINDWGVVEWCEITRDCNFFDCSKKYSWIVTNPPRSQIRAFLNHSMKLANNVVFLMTINHAFTTCRMREVSEAGFAIREILRVPWPSEFPKSGFALGAVHWQKGYDGKSIRYKSLV